MVVESWIMGLRGFAVENGGKVDEMLARVALDLFRRFGGLDWLHIESFHGQRWRSNVVGHGSFLASRSHATHEDEGNQKGFVVTRSVSANRQPVDLYTHTPCRKPHIPRKPRGGLAEAPWDRASQGRTQCRVEHFQSG